MSGPEYFSSRWKPIRRRKARRNKKPEPRSDAIGSQKELAAGAAPCARCRRTSAFFPFRYVRAGNRAGRRRGPRRLAFRRLRQLSDVRSESTQPIHVFIDPGLRRLHSAQKGNVVCEHPGDRAGRYAPWIRSPSQVNLLDLRIQEGNVLSGDETDHKCPLLFHTLLSDTMPAGR